MKKYLFAFFTLIIMMTATAGVNAGSPQQCRIALDNVMKNLKHKGNHFSAHHFWDLKNQKEINKFKALAQAAGLWTQFAHVCNAWSKEQCLKCTCGSDFTDAGCSLNCGCCWGNTRCSP